MNTDHRLRLWTQAARHPHAERVKETTLMHCGNGMGGWG
jgi:hypothetical protein